MSGKRNEERSRGRGRTAGRVSAFAIVVICLIGVVATVNLAVGVLQVGVIGGLNKRLSAVETLAASDTSDDFDISGGRVIGMVAGQSGSTRGGSHALSRMQAWTVSVYPLPRLPISIETVARDKVAAGTFMHSGSWISMTEHNKHDGLLVPGSVALNIKGVFLPAETDRYVFRLDLRYDGELRNDVVFACYGRFGAGRKATVLSGKILFHSLNNQSRHRTLMAQKSVPMTDGNPYQLKTTVFCNLPADVSAKDVMFRLSVRGADDAVFRSVRSILWPVDQVPANPRQSTAPEIQSVPSPSTSAPPQDPGTSV